MNRLTAKPGVGLAAAVTTITSKKEVSSDKGKNILIQQIE